jgi:hypothetical protein
MFLWFTRGSYTSISQAVHAVQTLTPQSFQLATDVCCEGVRRLLVAACVVPSSPIFVALMKEAPGCSETSVLTRATQRNNQEDTILHSHRRENLKSYERRLVCGGSHRSFHMICFLKLPSFAVVLMANNTYNIAVTGAMILRETGDQQQI